MPAGTPPPQIPQLDPNIQKLSDQQLKDSQDFQAQDGGLKQSQGNMAADASNMGLAQTGDAINKNANSRGLLYSGLRQGAMAKAQGGAATELSGKQADINSNVTQQVQQMNNQALQSQMGAQNITNQRNALAYNIAMNK
jgi:hypothetical protein